MANHELSNAFENIGYFKVSEVLKGTAGEVANTVGDAASKANEALKGTVGDVANTVGDAASKAKGKLTGFFSNEK